MLTYLKVSKLPLVRICLMVTTVIALFIIAQPGDTFAKAADEVVVSGRFEVVWGDPRPGYKAESPKQYFLTNESGKSWTLEFEGEVDLPEGLVKVKEKNKVKGLEKFNLRNVQITGRERNGKSLSKLKVDAIALAFGEVQAAGVPQAITGSVPWATLLCKFADNDTEPEPLSYFIGLIGINDEGDDDVEPEMNHYWQELSYNNVDIAGSMEFDWRYLPKNRADYFNVDGDALLDDLAQDCYDAHAPHDDLTVYTGFNFMFNGNLDCCAWGGGGKTWMPPWGWRQQGVMAHEMGHGFGLPHSGGPYDDPYDSQWDVMSDANNEERDPDPVYGPVGVHTISDYKDMLGAIPAARKYVADASANQYVTLERLALPGSFDYLMAQIPVGIPGLEYYTIEARRYAGYDRRLNHNPGGEAVVMHTVDTTRDRRANVVDVDNNGNPSDAASAWLPGELFEDTVNNISMAVVNPTSSGFVVVINPVTDIEMLKYDSPDPVMAGEQLYYTLTVANQGGGPAVGLVVTDILPDGVTFITDDLGICVEAPAGTLTCDIGILDSGDSTDITIKVEVDTDLVMNAGGPTQLCNEVSVVHDTPDTDSSNDTVVECTIVEDQADLKLTKVCKPDRPLVAGETAECTLFVDNHGPSYARDVVLTDTNLSDGSFDIVSVTTSQGPCIVSPDGIIICNLGSLEPASSSDSGRATVVVEITADEAMDINNVADVISDTPDPDMSNNQASEHISVTAVADLQVTKSDLPDPVIAGEVLTYSLEVTNNGPSTAVNVLVEDNLPDGVTINSVDAPGGTCSAGTPGDVFDPTTCTFDSLAPTDSATMEVEVTVLPETLGLIHNDARASSDTPDMDNSNDLVTVDTMVNAEADLMVAKYDYPDPVVAGLSMTYELWVTNNGPSLATDVTLTDTLPDGVVFTNATVSNGTGTCVLLETPPNTVSCQLNDLGPDEYVIVYIEVLVSSSVPDGTILVNSAVVESAALDPNAGNSTAVQDTAVEAVADLAVLKTTDQDLYKSSSTVPYHISVENYGPSDALDVVVVDELPPRKTGYVVHENGGCSLAGTTLTCPLGTIAAGDTVEFQVYFRVIGNKRMVTNTATVATTTYDPDAGSNSAVRNILVQGKNTGRKNK